MNSPERGNNNRDNRNKRGIAPLRDFLANESASGFLLMAAAALGLLAANLPISNYYFDFLDLAFEIDFLGIYLSLTVLKVINYGLMTIFFFVVGLEIKRELTSGNLSKFRQAAAPFFCSARWHVDPSTYLFIDCGRHRA